jgi:hypothetical protein
LAEIFPDGSIFGWIFSLMRTFLVKNLSYRHKKMIWRNVIIESHTTKYELLLKNFNC